MDTTQQKITDALRSLDPSIDADWTVSSGKPSMEAMKRLTGLADLTRAQVDAVAPDFVRPSKPTMLEIVVDGEEVASISPESLQDGLDVALAPMEAREETPAETVARLRAEAGAELAETRARIEGRMRELREEIVEANAEIYRLDKRLANCQADFDRDYGMTQSECIKAASEQTKRDREAETRVTGQASLSPLDRALNVRKRQSPPLTLLGRGSKS